MDLLSYCVHRGSPILDHAVLVLNSTAMKSTAIAAIRELGIQHVDLYLDRDNSGRQLTEQLQAALPDLEVTDCSDLYAPYQDFNAYLMAKNRQTSFSFH